MSVLRKLLGLRYFLLIVMNSAKYMCLAMLFVFCRDGFGYENEGAAYRAKKNEALFNLACDESNRALPIFGRYVVLPNGKRTSYFRSLEDRLDGYYHECILRKPVRSISNKWEKMWKARRIRYRSYNKLGGEKFYELQRSLGDLVNVTARIAAECYQYGLDYSMIKAVDIINGCYSSGSYGMWEGVSKGRRGSVSRVEDKLNSIKRVLHEKLDELDRIHKKEFEDWKRANRADAMEKSLENARMNNDLCKDAERTGKGAAQQARERNEEEDRRWNSWLAEQQRQNEQQFRDNQIMQQNDEIRRRQDELNDNVNRYNRELENFKRDIQFQFPGTIFLP